MENILLKATVATAFVSQGESLLREVIGARYSLEMAMSRDQSVKEIAMDTARYQSIYSQKQWEALQFEKMVYRVTNLTIEELRSAQLDLATVFNRRTELEQEIRNRDLLSSSLLNVLIGKSDEETVKLKQELDETLKDTELLREHLEKLTELSMNLASKIGYNDVVSSDE